MGLHRIIHNFHLIDFLLTIGFKNHLLKLETIGFKKGLAFFMNGSNLITWVCLGACRKTFLEFFSDLGKTLFLREDGCWHNAEL